MTETVENLEKRLEQELKSDAHSGLLAKGLARGRIWQNGVLPVGAPTFDEHLSEDLLDYGHAVLFLALRLRSLDNERDILSQAFKVAGEAIESVVYKGSREKYRGFNRICSAASYHLGGYSAQAYTILASNNENLTTTEKALEMLILRDLNGLNEILTDWLFNQKNHDDQLAVRLQHDIHFTSDDAVHHVLINSYMRGFANYNYAIVSGDEDAIRVSVEYLQKAVSTAEELHFVDHWWTTTLAIHLLDELWKYSLNKRIPVLQPHNSDYDRWNELRLLYIHKLRMSKRSVIEFWPSQLEAAERSINKDDDLVVALPTGAGKTRIAELCILRALASGGRVLYISPLRALSAQIERDLRTIFRPLGFSVSTLYGSAGMMSSDVDIIQNNNISVATPEKIDFMIRGNPSSLNDVCLVVLDEGHMVDSNERGIRFEVLVQQLLLRKDSAKRRIVCLSALFPSPDEMRDFVDWIRQDKQGGAVHKQWQPTRQVFGHIKWENGSARLRYDLTQEATYIPNFISEMDPIAGSRRRIKFPRDKQELTLASAWTFVDQGEKVIIYCPARSSVEAFGKCILKCVRQGLLREFPVNEKILRAEEIGTEWLGEEHVALKCLNVGVALHHGRLPHPYRKEVESIMNSEDWPIIIASPTIAQGLNLSASVLLLPHISREMNVIDYNEFKNVSGRSGRAFTTTEGLVLHILMNDRQSAVQWSYECWRKLIAESKLTKISSGILSLLRRIVDRIENEIGRKRGQQITEELLKKMEGWIIEPSDVQETEPNVSDWEMDIALLDAAVLGLLNTNANIEDIQESINTAFNGSLFTRCLGDEAAKLQTVIQQYLKCRAQLIWSSTDKKQRMGYKIAGIGLHAGKHIDENLDKLIGHLVNFEAAIESSNIDSVSESIASFAEIVFKVAPFNYTVDSEGKWKDALMGWMNGTVAKDVVKLGGKNGSGILREAITYRLPWAIEAVRGHAAVMGYQKIERVTGLSASAVTAGSINKSIITLLCSGLDSRDAARLAVESTNADFTDQDGMLEWLRSREVQEMSLREEWPARRCHRQWRSFVEQQIGREMRSWKVRTKQYAVEWLGTSPAVGTKMGIAHDNIDNVDYVVTPSLLKIGRLVQRLRQIDNVIRVSIDNKEGTVTVEDVGPED